MLGWLRKNADNGCSGRSARSDTSSDVEKRRQAAHVLLARGDILRWRDDNLEYIELETRRSLGELIATIDNQLVDTHHFQLKSFDTKQAKPLIDKTAKSVMKRCRQRAIETLQQLPGAQPIAAEEKKHTEIGHLSGQNLGVTGDSVLAAAGLIGGAAAVPVTASMATVSATGLAGLFGATVISWPVVLVGGAISLVLFGSGTLKGKSVAKKKDDYRKKLHAFLNERFLLEDQSLVSLLQVEIEQAARLLEDQITERRSSC